MSWLPVIPAVLVVASGALFAFLMHKRHPHQWAVSDAVFTPPVKREFRVSLDPEDVNRLLYGFTTVYWVCDCGKLKTSIYLGDQREAFPIEAG